MHKTGLPKDMNKALELWNRSAELGSINAHDELGSAYFLGDGVKKDIQKAWRHWELAAIGGHEIARHCLGMKEEMEGNMDRAYRHFIMAARCGYDDSLKEVGEGYKAGHVTKEDYASTLRAHKASMKSEERTEAVSIRNRES